MPMHDHTPHHGGVVSMVGMLHLEAVASADGRLRVYLTDRWRTPLPLDDVSGAVAMQLPDGPRTVPLAAGRDAMEGTAPPLSGTVVAAVTLRRAGEPIEANFALPVGAPGGAAGVPLAGCAPVPAGAAGMRTPRCVLQFAKSVAALAATPDDALLLAAIIDSGLSAWRLPAGTFAFGFAPPPAIPVPASEPPHPEAPNALIVRPDGREVAIAMENRLIVYAADRGAVLRSFEGPGGVLRAAAWSPDGRALLVSAFYHPDATLLDAADGRVLHRYPVAREAAAVTFAADGRTVAVGSETGAIALYDIDGTAPRRTLTASRDPARVLTIAGERLLAAGDDAVLRAWDPATGALRYAVPLSGPAHRLALSPDGGRAAIAGTSRDIAIIDLHSGTILETLRGHDAQILGLAWAGTTLASGDFNGRVALWDAP